MNGVEKHRTTNKNENFEYKGLESGKLYTILIDIRNTETMEYIGSVVKQIKTIEPNKPELLGFNQSMTYYVTYEKNETTGELTEVIGNNITNDGSNIPQSGWYDYSNKMWANIVVTDGKVENGKITGATMTTYYTWIPRYAYKITPEQESQPAVGRTEVRFIKDTLTEEEIKEGWQIPEAFTFTDQELTGYWSMKYTAGG